MSSLNSEWLASGKGTPPRQTWAFTADAPLADLQLARETGETLVADVLGGLYRLDRNGRVLSMNRGFKQLRFLAWSETGQAGAAVIADNQLCRFDQNLKVTGTLEVRAAINAVAVDPFGHYLAVALATGENFLLGADKRRVSEFVSLRPLHFLRFVATERDLLGAADYGLLLRQRFDGEPLWNEKLWNTVGDLAITGDGQQLFLAAFSHGVQLHDGQGGRAASFVVNGSPSRLATSFDGSVLGVATQEGYLYWLDARGQLLWAAEAPEELTRLHCDPLGRGLICGLKSGRVLRLDWR